MFKSIWSNFKEYKNESTSGKRYNPTVNKFVIQRRDFSDVNISNFIIFYIKKYGYNDKLKLNELAQYLSHCFKFHNDVQDLSKGFESFPKAYFTWYSIHKTYKSIKVVNVPTVHSNSTPITSPSTSGQEYFDSKYKYYPVHHCPFYQPQPYGYFAAKQVYNYLTIKKLKEYYGDKVCPESIINCFEKHGITDSYFNHHKRKEFVQLLKNECNVSNGEGMKIWKYFKTNKQ